MTNLEKAQFLADSMKTLEAEYIREDRPMAARRVQIARVQLMADPMLAARLVDMMANVNASHPVKPQLLAQARTLQAIESSIRGEG